MRAFLSIPLLAVLGSCGSRSIGFEVVSIRPIFGWADGCNAVKISGHGFATSAEQGATSIGDKPVTDLTLPDSSLDIGYTFTATVPAGTPGYADVTVHNKDAESTLTDGYFYVECPAPALIEAASPTKGVTAEMVIHLTGCNLDAAAFTAKVGDAEPVPLTSACGTGEVTFVAPDLADGAYGVSLLNADGEVVFPTPCDTADTGASCDVAPVLTYGEAQ